MVNLDIRINIIGQNEDNIIIDFSVPDEWSNIQEVAKTATMQDFIALYETITPDEVTKISSSTIMNRNFNN